MESKIFTWPNSCSFRVSVDWRPHIFLLSFLIRYCEKSICDRLWENPPSSENLKKFVMVKFIIYGPLALYCANFKAIAFMTPEEQLLESVH